MELFIIVILAALAAIFQAIISYRENQKSKNLHVLLLLVIIVLSVVSSINISKEQKDKARETKTLKSGLASTSKKLNESIQQEAILLDSMNKIKDSITTISKNVGIQLLAEQEVNTTTQALLLKSEILSSSAKNTYANTDKLLHPLFPLTFSIIFTVPFDAPDIKPLVNYMYDLKAQCESEVDLPVGLYIEGNKPGPKDITEIALAYDYIKDKKLYFDNLFYKEMEIRLLKTPSNKKITDIETPQMNFIFGAEMPYLVSKRDIHVFVYYVPKFIQFKIDYINYKFQSSSYNKTNIVIGSNELQKCVLLFNEYYNRMPGFQLKSLVFYPINGLQSPITIDFHEKDTLKTSVKKTFYHRITKLETKDYGEYDGLSW